MNLILKFGDSSKRDGFLRQFAHERGDIIRLYMGSKNLPNAVVTSLSAEQAAWIRHNVDPFGKAYDDIQFDTFSG